jgi:hypothetical protein
MRARAFCVRERVRARVRGGESGCVRARVEGALRRFGAEGRRERGRERQGEGGREGGRREPSKCGASVEQEK